MDRRQALQTAGALAALAATHRAAFAQAEDSLAGISPAAQALYQRALVFDGNCGPRLEGNLPEPKEILDEVRNAGVTAVKTSLGGTDSNFADTVEEIAFGQRVVEAHHDVFMQIREYADFERCKREKKFGVIFSFESVEMLDGKPERISLFRNLGVRVMQLSYNKVSPFGSGVLADPPSGLTDVGHKAVETMNAEGVAIDISHASKPMSYDVLKLSKKPVLITHAGCNAVHRHPRNKDDALLRAVAHKGGVVGIYDLPYLTPSPRQPTLDDYMAHMTHALKVCGEDHVGIGSDSALQAWDTSPKAQEEFQKEVERRRKTGVAAPEEDRPLYVVGLNTTRRCEVIADALLKRGYSARVAEKVLGRNFIEALGRIWA